MPPFINLIHLLLYIDCWCLNSFKEEEENPFQDEEGRAEIKVTWSDDDDDKEDEEDHDDAMIALKTQQLADIKKNSRRRDWRQDQEWVEQA